MPSNNRRAVAIGVAWLVLSGGLPSFAQERPDAAPAASMPPAAYDEVSFAAPAGTSEGVTGGGGVTAAHISLPTDNFAEVTVLTTGRTILVRIDGRAPAGGPSILLSPDAAAQLRIVGMTPARIRRVNPIAQEQAVLRAGGKAAARLDAPPALLTALRNRMPSEPSERGKSIPPPKPAQTDPPKPATAVAAKPLPAPASSESQTPRAESGKYVVQIAALSSAARAQALARRLGGTVTASGPFWRVRLGPFATRSEAKAAVELAAGKGFKNGRIMANDAS